MSINKSICALNISGGKLGVKQTLTHLEVFLPILDIVNHEGGQSWQLSLSILYSAEQRERRDHHLDPVSVLAPLQFAVFAISLGLCFTYLLTGEG